MRKKGSNQSLVPDALEGDILNAGFTQVQAFNSATLAFIKKKTWGSLLDGVAIEYSLFNRLRAGVLWSLSGSVINAVISLLLNVTVARLFGVLLFGEFSIVQGFVITVSGISQLAMGYTASKYIAESRALKPERIGGILGLCGTVSIVTSLLSTTFVLVAAPMVAEFLGAVQLTPYLRFAAFAVFFSVMNGFYIGALSGFEKFKLLSISLILGTISTFSFVYIGAAVYGIGGAILALGCGAFVQWVILSVFLHKTLAAQKITIDVSNIFSEASIVFDFAFPAALSGLASMSAIWFSQSFLVRSSNGIQEMALYAAANSLKGFVLFVPQVVNRVMQPVLNSSLGDAKKYKQVFRLNLLLTLTLSIFGAVLLQLAAGPILGLFGKEFKSGSVVLTALMVSAIIEALGIAAYQKIQTNARMWTSLLGISFPRESILILASFILSPIYGGVGLAVSFLLASLAATSATLILNKAHSSRL